ncbi:MAG: triacylglycerol lipase [Phycisphaerales bacterium]|nr:triacylglycerol lipase [Phycisphaerales bacterium]
MIPIVLHHGLILPGNLRVGPLTIGSFVGIDRVLAERGYPLVLTQVHPTAGVTRRARQLKKIILERLRAMDAPPRTKVIIFAHSMGGLDARHMITHLGMADRVAALVTLSTPHRGSPYADWCLRHLKRFKALQVLNMIGIDTGAATELTTETCARFNDATPDAPGVRYFSISAARPLLEISPLLYQPYRIVNAADGPNDGLVSIKSATWGVHLETWPVDHFHILNRRLLIEWKKKTGDVRPYYAALLDRLVKEDVLPRRVTTKRSSS